MLVIILGRTWQWLSQMAGETQVRHRMGDHTNLQENNMSEQMTQSPAPAPETVAQPRKVYHAPRLSDFGEFNELTRAPYKFGMTPDFGDGDNTARPPTST